MPSRILCQLHVLLRTGKEVTIITIVMMSIAYGFSVDAITYFYLVNAPHYWYFLDAQ